MNTAKINWDDSIETPTEETRAVASSGSSESVPETKPVDDSVDVDALAKAKPLFVYFYVDPISDPMDSNYKFSRKFELSVLGEEIVDILNKNFNCKKVVLPADADMKLVKNQARIEVWSPTNQKIGLLSVNDENLLNKSPFIAFAKARVAKSAKLVKDEIARIQESLKAKESAKKESASKE